MLFGQRCTLEFRTMKNLGVMAWTVRLRGRDADGDLKKIPQTVYDWQQRLHPRPSSTKLPPFKIPYRCTLILVSRTSMNPSCTSQIINHHSTVKRRLTVLGDIFLNPCTSNRGEVKEKLLNRPSLQ